MNINELKKRIADAGCVGAGGAGFPTAVKVAEGADSLIINAAECEPLLYTDYYVMKRAMERIASGASKKDAVREVSRETGFPKNALYDAVLRMQDAD